LTPQARKQTILRLVQEREIRNQGELVRALEKAGVSVTQATVSRDLKRLGLVKVPTSNGRARYQAPALAERSPLAKDELRTACRNFLTEVVNGEGLLLLKTLSGRASALAIALDEARLPEIAGTLAGDDTVLVIFKNQKDRARLERRLRRFEG
jgi:transcriptional regulator of arginine metabolism